MKKHILLLALLLATTFGFSQAKKTFKTEVAIEQTPAAVPATDFVLSIQADGTLTKTAILVTDVQTGAFSLEGYDESGTKAGLNLIVGLGDYSLAGNGTGITLTDATGLTQLRSNIWEFLSNVSGFKTDIDGDGLTANRTFTLPNASGIPALDVNGVASSTVGSITLTTQNLTNDGEDGINKYITLSDIYQGNTLINGDYYHDTGFTYQAWADLYIIDGVVYNTLISDAVTLSPAHATLDRIDVIVVNNNGTITAVTGTAAANPVKPEIDLDTQVEMTFVLVQANTTTPASVTELLVYDENAGDPTEWDSATSDGSITLAATGTTQSGTNAIRFNTAAVGDQLTLTDLTTISSSDYNKIIFYVKLDNVLDHRIRLTLSNTGGSDVSNTATLQHGSYGLDTSNTSTYQLIIIPVSDLAIGVQTYDRLTIYNDKATASFYVDNMILQTGTNPVAGPTITNTSQLINDGPDGVNPYLTSLTESNIYNSDGTITVNRVIDADGNSISIDNANGDTMLLIDTTLDAEVAKIGAINPANGGNDASFEGSTSATLSTSTTQADYDNGTQTASQTLAANAGSSSITAQATNITIQNEAGLNKVEIDGTKVNALAGANGLKALSAGTTDLVGLNGLRLKIGTGGVETPSVVGYVPTATNVNGNVTWQPGGASSIYNADGSLAGNRIMSLNGNTLRVNDAAGNSALEIDPTINTETTVVSANNATGGGNEASVDLSTTDTDVVSELKAQFNGGAKQASILQQVDVTESSTEITTDVLKVVLPTPPTVGQFLQATNVDGTVDWTTSLIRETSNNLFGGSTAGANIVIDGGNTGFGVAALESSNAINNSGFGFEVLRENAGQRVNGFGLWAGKRNTADDGNFFGQESGQFNKGARVVGFGGETVQNNQGDDVVGIGNDALIYNEGNQNTAVGSESFVFLTNVAGLKSFVSGDVTAGTDRIAITAHNFGTTGAFVNLLYSGVTGGITNGKIYQFEIIDANTIELITDSTLDLDGTEDGDLTPQYTYTNATTIGYNSQPTASNQVTLGNATVTEVDTYGALRARAYGAGTQTGTATYNLVVDVDGNVIEEVLTPQPILAIDEGNGVGYVLGDSDRANYGNVGLSAVDLSYNGSPSTTKGAGGDYSFVAGEAQQITGGVASWGAYTIGTENTIGGTNTTAAGALGAYNTISNGYATTAIGAYNTINTADNGFGAAIGMNNVLSNTNPAGTFGTALISKSRHTLAVGVANVDYTETGNEATRPIFVVGNGTTTTPAGAWAASVRSDALRVDWDGTITAPSFSTAEITTAGNASLITKEYADANYSTGGDVTAASNFSADNTVILSDGTGKGVKNSTIANSTYNIADAWDGYAAVPDTYGWNGIAGGDGAWVATSYNGTNRVMWSDDNGQTWTNVASSNDANQWRHVSYGGGVFIALSTSGTNRVMRSTDGGLTWTGIAAAVDTSSWNSVAYGNGVFVAVASSGTNRTMYSTDLGLTWTAVAAAVDTSSWQAIAYGGGVFVAVSSDGTNRTMWSDDLGLSWTAVASAVETNQWFSIAYGDGNFVSVSIDGTNRAMISDDLGLTWSSSTTTPSNTNVWRDVVYGNGTWIAVANSGTNKVSRSVDNGDTWTAITPSDDLNTWRNVAYSGGVFVSVADSGTNRVMTYSPGANALLNTNSTVDDINASATGFEYTTVDWVNAKITETSPDLSSHVTKTGTPAANQLSRWTGDGVLGAIPEATWDGSNFTFGDINGILTLRNLTGYSDIYASNRLDIESNEGLRVNNIGKTQHVTIIPGAGTSTLTAPTSNGIIATTAYVTSNSIDNVLEDITPQLGGNLDVLTREITTSTVNGDIELSPNGTGRVFINTGSDLEIGDGGSLSVSNLGTGDAVASFTAPNFDTWAIGNDDSAAAFVIDNGFTLGTNPPLSIDHTTGDATFNGDHTIIKNDVETTTPILLLDQTSTGDAFQTWTNATKSYSMGIDNSATENFFISHGTDLSTNPMLEFGDNGEEAYFRVNNIYHFTDRSNTTTGWYMSNVGTGDIKVTLNAGAETYSFGVDNSDGDKFKISNTNVVGTEDMLSFTPGTYDAEFTGELEYSKGVADDTTTAYELVLGDRSGIVTMNNAAANTLTIPANASVAFPIGTEIVIINKGAGVTTVAITTDTLNQNVGGLTLAQYDKRTLTKITATSWILGY